MRETSFRKLNVSINVVRDFHGAMIGCVEKDVILTTGGFIRDGAPSINELKEPELGVSNEMVEVVEVNRDWFNFI